MSSDDSIEINAGRDVEIGGDVVGRDKIINHPPADPPVDPGKAHVIVTIETCRPPHQKFVIYNHGPGVASDVTFEYDSADDNPPESIAQEDREMLPIPQIHPGTSKELRFPLDSGYAWRYKFACKWTNPDGSPGEFSDEAAVDL